MALSAENRDKIRELIADINANPARMKQIAEMTDEEAMALIARWEANKALYAQVQPLFNDSSSVRVPKIFGFGD